MKCFHFSSLEVGVLFSRYVKYVTDFVQFGVLNCETMEQWLPGSPYGKHKAFIP